MCLVPVIGTSGYSDHDIVIDFVTISRSIKSPRFEPYMQLRTSEKVPFMLPQSGKRTKVLNLIQILAIEKANSTLNISTLTVKFQNTELLGRVKLNYFSLASL